MTKALPYDSAEFLHDDVAIREYMNEALVTNDAALIAHAVGVVARARSMAVIARKTGLSRGSLYRALSSEGQPELATVLKVLGAVGITLTSTTTARPRASKTKPLSKSTTAKGSSSMASATRPDAPAAKAAKRAARK
jgi:probable addiction module antidote protein